jgi:hypothetical protein
VVHLELEFTGINIHLKNQLLLLPHGVIDYPFNESSGKRQEYKKGQAVNKEFEYAT